MIECEFCKTPLPENHPALIAQSIDKKAIWSNFESDRYGHKVGDIVNVKGTQVKVLKKKLKPDMDEVEYGYWGEEGAYPQGTTFKAYIVLEAEGMLFKKQGTADSYGEVVWDEPLRVTEAITKTVVEYR